VDTENSVLDDQRDSKTPKQVYKRRKMREDKDLVVADAVTPPVVVVHAEQPTNKPMGQGGNRFVRGVRGSLIVGPKKQSNFTFSDNKRARRPTRSF
jgi:hypothetical protein